MCSDLVSKIKSEIDIKEFVSKHYGVEWEGKVAICCFPDHREKTPSMYFVDKGSNEENYIFCQGCKRGGNIFTFVGIMEELDCKTEFVEILKKICELENIEFKSNNKSMNPSTLAILEKKTDCTLQFQKDLWNDKSSDGFNYLLDRGFTDETISKFFLGITKNSNETRYSSYINEKINISNRISIPILNSSGDKTIAISFRSLMPGAKRYKYLHDESDEVFQKKNVFYGYSHAIKHIKEKKHCYIVEGYFDMISMYQAGMKNTMACMSNQMTAEQIQLLSKITKSVTIILDQDSAGKIGFFNTLPLLLSEGLSVKVVASLDFLGKDINDLCNELEWDNTAIISFIESHSKDAVMFFLNGTLEQYDEHLLLIREVALRNINSIFDCIVDPIQKQNYKYIINNRIGVNGL